MQRFSILTCDHKGVEQKNFNHIQEKNDEDSDIEIYDDFRSEEFVNIEKYFLDYNVGFEGESVPWYWVMSPQWVMEICNL